MSIDGDIDYSSYSREQLIDALENIDRARYPLNFSKLNIEFASRPVSQTAVVAVDPRPEGVRAAVGLIWFATGVQVLLVLILILASVSSRVLLTHVLLLATLIFLGVSIQAKRMWARFPVASMPVMVVLGIAIQWDQVSWYSGRWPLGDILFDLSRFASIVIAAALLYRPESTQWFVSQDVKVRPGERNPNQSPPGSVSNE